MGQRVIWALGAVVVEMVVGCGGGEGKGATTAGAGAPATAPSLAPAPAPAAAPTPAPTPASAPASGPASTSAPATPAEPAHPPTSFVEETAAAAPSPTPSIAISSPKKDEVLDGAKAGDTEVKFKLTNWKLEGGKAIELVLDDRTSLIVSDPSRTVHLKDIDPSPAATSAGQHLLVGLLRGAGGQWVKPPGKGRGPIAVAAYYVARRTGPVWKETDPLLIYAGPPAGPAPAEGLLVDYYLVNAELGREKYAVKASVTGPDLMTGKVIESWKPWRIHGARQGSYTVRLELDRYEHQLGESSSSTTVVLDSKAVGGRWTSVTRDFDLPPP